MQDANNNFSSQQSTITSVFFCLSQKLQKCLDDLKPFRKTRWIAAFLLIHIFIMRIIVLKGWYIVSYGLAAYHLKLFMLFLSTKIDAILERFGGYNLNNQSAYLPNRENEEFITFIGRLSEYKFWYSVVKSTLLSIFLTFFQCFDIPILGVQNSQKKPPS